MATLLGLLTSPRLIPGLAALLVLYLVVGAVVNYRKLRQFKGPPLAAVSRIYIFWQSVRHRFHISEYEALQKYGSPCRFGPNLVITDDADIIRHISAPRSAWSRADWYDAMRHDPRQDSVFSTKDEKHHADLRAKMIGAYIGRDIDTIEPETDKIVVDFVNLIKTTYSGKAMDISITSQFFTLDVLSAVAFGQPFGYVKANRDIYNYTQASTAFLSALELASNHAFVRWVFYSPLFRWLAAPKDSDEFGIGPILRIAHDAVAERFAGDQSSSGGGGAKASVAGTTRRDMLGHMVGKGLNQLECEVEAYVQIIGGAESTTSTIRTTMYLLLSNPGVYAKLRAEIDAAVDRGDISYPVVTYAQARQLPYLQACIWEGLRMYPPLFGLKSKLAPPGGDTIKGIYFPEGTEVGLCDAAMCRRKDIFGDDADVFRPDRWVDADPATRALYDRTVHTIFGAGRYECLGKHIAMVELHKVFVELIRNFDWAISNPLKGIVHYGHGVHVQKDMFLTAWPRQH
ncbi:hypothetical protein A1O3_04312 [Capronia epimyces CBS 606.96]|uniref:Cytochrome P450 oxidoreductase n=1 Tax=Capronia epimyces CBS 606.96 TaxID=1182542 RepID=W9Y4E7_9EURO|nr:uncharacterized protein A1O3_04312 [Capronia epimyces CBS 606.96]EXJ87353.1 hypothetical protein A1O3_04312 [Capronia epimyces CBS 606.96]